MILDQVFTARNEQQPGPTYKKDAASEKPLRSIAKTVSWRVVGTIDTIFISWIVTGALTLAFSIGAIELVTKMVLYFFHERIWNTITWGR